MWTKKPFSEITTLQKQQGVEDTLVLNSNNRLQLHEALLNHA